MAIDTTVRILVSCRVCSKPRPAGSQWPDCCSKECYESLFNPQLEPLVGRQELAGSFIIDRAELLRLHDIFCAQAKAIMVKKNQDYTGGSKSIDPFFNFRGSVALGIEPEMGLMIRMQDKFQRVCAFINNGTLAVNDEGVKDIIHDLINYSILLGGLLLERQNKIAEEASKA